VDIIRGTKDRRFSSKAAHAKNQFLEAIAIKELKIKVERIKIFLGTINIRSWRFDSP
jgi:hypothetical protein